jgi:hypothetical protein
MGSPPSPPLPPPPRRVAAVVAAAVATFLTALGPVSGGSSSGAAAAAAQSRCLDLRMLGGPCDTDLAIADGSVPLEPCDGRAASVCTFGGCSRGRLNWVGQQGGHELLRSTAGGDEPKQQQQQQQPEAATDRGRGQRDVTLRRPSGGEYSRGCARLNLTLVRIAGDGSEISLVAGGGGNDSSSSSINMSWAFGTGAGGVVPPPDEGYILFGGEPVSVPALQHRLFLRLSWWPTSGGGGGWGLRYEWQPPPHGLSCRPARFRSMDTEAVVFALVLNSGVFVLVLLGISLCNLRSNRTQHRRERAELGAASVAPCSTLF